MRKSLSLRAYGAPAGRARPLPAFGLAFVVCLALGALVSSSAFAVVSHPFLSSFGGGGTPAGVKWEPIGLAVDDSGGVSAGEVYVSDNTNTEAHPNTVVDRFAPAPGSAFLCQITGASGSLSAPLTECDFEDAARPGTPAGAIHVASGVAVDSASGDVWVADTANGVVAKFSAAGVYESEIAGLLAPTAVAVNDATHDVYIVDSGDNTVKRFDPGTSALTTFATETPAGAFGELQAVAVDNSSGVSAGDVYVADSGGDVVDKFSAAGIYESQLTGTPTAPFGSGDLLRLATDPADGALYVSDAGGRAVDQFDASGVFQGQLTTGSAMTPTGVGVASSGDVYVIDAGVASGAVVDVFGPGVVVPGVTTGQATEIQPTSAKLEGSVNPAGSQLTGCRFDYVTDAAFKETGFSTALTAACSPPAGSIPPDSSDHAITAAVSGLQAGATYHYRLEASNANCAACTSFGEAATFSTPPPPSIDSAVVSNLTTTAADLVVKINPNGLATSYFFEYDTTPYGAGEPPHGTRVPAQESEDAMIPAGTGDVVRSQHIAPLDADKLEYYWRVIASSANGTVTSPDHTFTYPTTGEPLPDDRQYEMVTPPRKNGAQIGAVGIFGVPEVAEDGTRVTAETIQCLADAQSCNAQRRDSVGSAYAFSRTPSGWVTHGLALSAAEFSEMTTWANNASTGAALFSAPTGADGEDDFYLRHSDGTIEHVGPVTPPEGGPQGDGGSGGREFDGTADLSHFVWEPTPAGKWPFDHTFVPHESSNNQLYEYAGPASQPLLVGVTGGEGSEDLVSTCGTVLGDPYNNRDPGRMSADGRTVYFTALGGHFVGGPECVGFGANANTAVPANSLNARIDGEGPEAHTATVSARSAADCAGVCLASSPSSAQFATASADGSKVLFTSTQQLTNDASEDNHPGDSAFGGNGCVSTVGENGCNLYLYDFANPAGHELVDVSANEQSGHGPRVRGVVAASADGSRVYFVAQGVLAENANADGQTASDGANNLYLYQRDAAHPAGITTFIAALPGSDEGEWTGAMYAKGVNVTPDGRFLLFLSKGSLTRDDTSRSGAEQVFRYDAVSGVLLRISVGNNGFDDNGNRSHATPCGLNGCAEDADIAPLGGREGPRQTSQSMSDDGTVVFFDSPVGLTPHALDNVRIGTDNEGVPVYAENVYEWHEGHVFLISDGRDVTSNAGSDPHCPGAAVGIPSSVCLLGTDASGSNVFFTTTDRLSGTDTDTAVDIYDARVCTAGDPCVPEPAAPAPVCSGEECHGVPVGQPGVPSGGSAALNAPGNLVSSLPVGVVRSKPVKCRKGFVKNKKGKCVRRSRRKRSKVKRSVHANRRAKR